MDIRCCALCLIVPSLLSFPFHENKLGHVRNCLLIIYMYTFMQAHRLCQECSLNIHFDYSNLTLTRSYTACSLSRTISLWISGPPCCSSCVTWQYIPLRRKHSTQEVTECVCVCVRKRGKAAVGILHALCSMFSREGERIRVCSMFVFVHVKHH